MSTFKCRVVNSKWGIISDLSAVFPSLFSDFDAFCARSDSSEEFFVLMQGNGNGDNKESLVALPHNVDSVKDGEEPASDAGKDSADIRVDEPASDGLTVVSVFCYLVTL